MLNSLIRLSKLLNNLFSSNLLQAICIIVGKVSFEDCDKLTWSLGCTGFFDPISPFNNLIVAGAGTGSLPWAQSTNPSPTFKADE